MPKVALTPAQKRAAWRKHFAAAVGRHINRHDPEAEYNSQAELAHDIGASRPGLSNIICGKTVPTLQSFARICNACNMSADEVGMLVLQLGGIRE